MKVWLLRSPRLGYLSWLDFESRTFGFDRDRTQACLFDSRHAARLAIESLRHCGFDCHCEPEAAMLLNLYGED